MKNRDVEVLEDLLKYIYTGDAPKIDSHVNELFEAVDQYQIEKLKELCEVKLSARLDVDSCIALLNHADKHHARTLKENALKYLSINLAAVRSKNPEWKNLKENPTLFAEVADMLLK